MKKSPILYIVIPCYNEEEVLYETTKLLNKKLQEIIKIKKISPKSKVMYVNDGSKDKTWDIIKKINGRELMNFLKCNLSPLYPENEYYYQCGFNHKKNTISIRKKIKKNEGY